jgi:molybdopterin-guanine dinucleotide biosynthesis protein A
VVANDPAAPGWFPDEHVIADDASGLGPLGGIATALATADGAGILVIAWDMPFLSVELLAELRCLGRAGVDAAVPRHHGRMEPLCAWYGPAALRTCRALLAAGQRRAAALAESLSRVEWLEGTALESLGDPEHLFTSVNTPEKLAALGGAHP